jgi:hypothetical protein
MNIHEGHLRQERDDGPKKNGPGLVYWSKSFKGKWNKISIGQLFLGISQGWQQSINDIYHDFIMIFCGENIMIYIDENIRTILL